MLGQRPAYVFPPCAASANVLTSTSSTAPRRGDFVGLHFVEPRDISQVIVIGGAALKGVGDSDATSSWEVQTLSATSKDWVRRITSIIGGRMRC